MLALLSHKVTPNQLFLALFRNHLLADMHDKLAAQDLLTRDAISAAANSVFDPSSQGHGVP
jgi:hypothetical protein